MTAPALSWRERGGAVTPMYEASGISCPGPGGWLA